MANLSKKKAYKKLLKYVNENYSDDTEWGTDVETETHYTMRCADNGVERVISIDCCTGKISDVQQN